MFVASTILIIALGLSLNKKFLVTISSAAKGEGIDELVSHVLHVAYYQERPQFYQHIEINKTKRLIVV